MKRILKYIIIALCFSFFLAGSVYANPNKITITAFGSPIQDGKGFLQNIMVSFKANSDWTLSVTALDSSIQNSENPNKSIDIQNLRIIDTSNSTEYIMETGKSIDIKSGILSTPGNNRINKQLQIRLLADETDYPGIYTANLQFNITTNNKYYSDVHTQLFNQPVIQHITVLPEVNNYQVPSDSLLSKGKSINLPQATRIMIRSNAKWKLNVLNESPSKLIEQYIKLKTLPQNVTNLIPMEYKKINRRELEIVRGEPTVSPGLSKLQLQVIELDYKFNLSEKDIIPSDVYPFNIQYQLGEIE